MLPHHIPTPECKRCALSLGGIAFVVEVYRSTRSIYLAGLTLGCTGANVSMHLRRHRVRMLERPAAELPDCSAVGCHRKALCARLTCGRRKCLLALRNARPEDPEVIARREMITRLHSQHLTQGQIADVTGLCRMTVSKHLRRAGMGRGQ